MLLTSSWKKTFIFIFSFFLNKARKSYAPFREIFFQHDKFLDGKFPQHIPPLLSLSLNQKSRLKTYLHFPIAITLCKHWSKFVTCSPSHGDCGGVSHPQRHSHKVFRLRWIKWLFQNFYPVTLRKLLAWEGA